MVVVHQPLRYHFPPRHHLHCRRPLRGTRSSLGLVAIAVIFIILYIVAKLGIAIVAKLGITIAVTIINTPTLCWFELYASVPFKICYG